MTHARSPTPPTAHHPPRHAARTRPDRLCLLACSVLSLGLVVMLARVVQLQVAPDDRLLRAAAPPVTARAELPMRGDVLDRRARLLAASRQAYRVVVDPVDFPDPPDDAMARLALALSRPLDAVAEPIALKLAENERRAAALRAAGLLPPDQPAAPPSLWNRLLARFSPPAPVAALSDDPQPASEPSQPASSPSSPQPTEPASKHKPLIRYVPLPWVLDDAQVAAVRAAKISGVHLERRTLREYPGDQLAGAILGKVGFDGSGALGFERALDPILRGQPGRVVYVRDALGRPLWIEEGGIQPARHGSDERLSIDLELQRIALEELTRGVEEADAQGGRIVLVEPATGEILAMADIIRPVPGLVPYPWADAPPRPGSRTPGSPRQPAATPTPGADGGSSYRGPSRRARYQVLRPDPRTPAEPALARNRCVEDSYEPGSSFKPFVWAAVTDLGKASPSEVFDTEGGRWATWYGRPIEDVKKLASMTWDQVLANSSNIGMVKAAERISHQQLRATLERFGFGARTGLPLAGESSGMLRPASVWTHWTQTSVAFGHEIGVTAVQAAAAFCAFARDGDLAGTVPSLRLRAASPSDSADAAPLARRAVSPRAALAARHAMAAVGERVAENMARLTPPETGWLYPMFGKSGTPEIPLGQPPPGKRRPRGASGFFEGQYNSNFVAAAPLDHPRLVVVVVIEDPGPALIARRQHYGTTVAGPVARRVLERSLAYLGVPPSTFPQPGPDRGPHVADARAPRAAD